MNAQHILQLYRTRGGLAYDGEGVTQLQHGWQCARRAHRAHANDALQLAAWLHDLGHLFETVDGSPTLLGIDDAHERKGALMLERVFGPDVSEPVALHVMAKRALVSTRPGYRERLSPDSTRSLALQGGDLRAEQLQDFLRLPHAADAMRLRVWDDDAKVVQERPASDEQALDALSALMTRVLAAGAPSA